MLFTHSAFNKDSVHRCTCDFSSFIHQIFLYISGVVVDNKCNKFLLLAASFSPHLRDDDMKADNKIFKSFMTQVLLSTISGGVDSDVQLVFNHLISS